MLVFVAYQVFPCVCVCKSSKCLIKSETDLGEVIMSPQHEGALVHRQHSHKGIRFSGDSDVHLATSIHQIRSKVHRHLQ